MYLVAVETAGEFGLLGLTIPVEYGGTWEGPEEGADPKALFGTNDSIRTIIANEQLAYQSPSFALSFLAHTLLLGHNLNRNGSDILKARYLPGIVSGELIGGVAMTESEVGSDLGNMRSRGVKVDGGWILNGSKQFITNGNGDLVIVYVNTRGEKVDIDPTVGNFDITAFLVRTDSDGFTLGEKEQKTGMRGSPTYAFSMEDMFVPDEYVVGEPHKGTRGMLNNLIIERFGLAPHSTGAAMRVFDEAMPYAEQRMIKGRPIYEFGQVGPRLLAEPFARLAGLRALLYQVGGMNHTLRQASLWADSAKLVIAVDALAVIDECKQVFGGNSMALEYLAGRFIADIALNKVGGGTLETHRHNIARELAGLDRFDMQYEP